MCIGDIIVVKDSTSFDGKRIGLHSYVIVDNKKGYISGIPYDFIAAVFSSFKNNTQRNKKISYIGNQEIKRDDIVSNKLLNNKEGYIKANQLTYFKKDKIDYYVIGSVKPKFIKKLLKLINKLEKENKIFKNYNNNLK